MRILEGERISGPPGPKLPLLAVALIILSRPAIAAPCTVGKSVTPNQKRDEATLLAIEHDWMRALADHNRKFLDCLLADDFQDSTGRGELRDKRALLDGLATRPAVAESFEEMGARIYGTTGIVRGVVRVNDKSGGVIERIRFTDVFLFTGDRWQAVAGQETLFAPPK